MTSPTNSNIDIVTVRLETTEGEPVDVVGIVNKDTKNIDLVPYGDPEVADQSRTDGDGPLNYAVDPNA
jgi:hypothetical protein